MTLVRLPAWPGREAPRKVLEPNGSGSSARAGTGSVFTPAPQPLVEPVLTQKTVSDVSSIHE